MGGSQRVNLNILYKTKYKTQRYHNTTFGGDSDELEDDDLEGDDVEDHYVTAKAMMLKTMISKAMTSKTIR
jgi:hypothetical protein